MIPPTNNEPIFRFNRDELDLGDSYAQNYYYKETEDFIKEIDERQDIVERKFNNSWCYDKGEFSIEAYDIAYRGMKSVVTATISAALRRFLKEPSSPSGPYNSREDFHRGRIVLESWRHECFENIKLFVDLLANVENLSDYEYYTKVTKGVSQRRDVFDKKLESLGIDRSLYEIFIRPIKRANHINNAGVILFKDKTDLVLFNLKYSDGVNHIGNVKEILRCFGQ